jgi:hypothetical protein
LALRARFVRGEVDPQRMVISAIQPIE